MALSAETAERVEELYRERLEAHFEGRFKVRSDRLGTYEGQSGEGHVSS